MSSFCFLDAVGRPLLYYSKRSFYFFIFGNSLFCHSGSFWMSSFCFLDAVGRPLLYYSKRSFYFFIFGNSLFSFWMSSFCFLDAVGRPLLYYSKRSFYFFIFGNSLFLNLSPSEWFYITRNGGSENQSRRFIGAWKCICFTTAFFLLPSCGRLTYETIIHWWLQLSTYYESVLPEYTQPRLPQSRQTKEWRPKR